MDYQYKIDVENQIINVITIGDLITKEVVAMGLIILLIAKNNKYKIVFDHRLSKNIISIAEAFFMFSQNYDSIDTAYRSIPTAYITHNSDWSFFSFFECTCNNNGIPIKAFLEENEALEWIKNR